jgi:Uma2 family endonuclease
MKSKYDFPRYTYNDYKNWKEDWELIDGYPLQFLPSATAKHNRIQGGLFFQSKLSLQKNESDCVCEIFTELDWKISEETVVRPDLMIICGKPLIDYLEFPPVLIVEIISPSSVKKDRVIKFDLYREQGVKYYIMADYTKETIEVYELIDNYYKEVNRTIFSIDKHCEVTFDFDAIWK